MINYIVKGVWKTGDPIAGFSHNSLKKALEDCENLKRMRAVKSLMILKHRTRVTIAKRWKAKS